MSEIFGFDAFSRKEIAARIETIGVAKKRLPLLSMLMLSVLAGIFIGLGALYFVLVKSDPSLSFATSQILGGVGLALLVVLSRHPEMNHGAIAQEYLRIAAVKVAMPFWTAFFKGVLCNVLVCVAVWMALAGRSVVDKAVAIVFPISAFVAAGFEHSVANLYLIPVAMLLQTFEHVATTADTITWVGFFHNLAPVIQGNIVGGSVLVGLVYYVIYRRAPSENPNA